MPVTCTCRPASVTWALTVSCKVRASPSESKPGPRLALVAGTTTVMGWPGQLTSSGLSSQAQGLRGCRDVDADGDRRLDARHRGVGILQPVPGDRADHY